MRKDGLVVVAHPDDELLFMGGTLIQRRIDVDWTIVCVTTDIEHGRDPEFLNVCAELTSRPVQLGFEMGWRPRVPVWPEAARKELRKIVWSQKWDEIYTHNAAGEYGHPQHKQVHAIMASFGRPLFCFGPGLDLTACATSHLDLTPDTKKEKQRLANLYTRKAKALRCYDFFDVDREVFGEHR